MSICKKIKFSEYFFDAVIFSTTLSRLAYNVVAAWRSGGFH
jgi:hypothetical protein